MKVHLFLQVLLCVLFFVGGQGNVVGASLDVVKSVDWVSRGDGNSITYNVGDVLEVAIGYKDESGLQIIDLTFFDTVNGSRIAIDMNDYEVAYSNPTILGTSNTSEDSKKKGNVNLPLLDMGVTIISIRSKSTGELQQEVLTVKVIDGMDELGYIYWQLPNNTNNKYDPESTIEVPIEYIIDVGTSKLNFVFWNRTPHVMDMHDYDILIGDRDILSDSTTADKDKTNGHVDLPLRCIGATDISIRSRSSGRIQKVVNTNINIFAWVLWVSRPEPSINYTMGDTIEVPLDYIAVGGLNEIDLIFFRSDGKVDDMNNYEVEFSNRGILGRTTTSTEWKGKGHAHLPVRNVGETTISIRSKNTGGVQQKVLTAKVIDEIDLISSIAWASQTNGQNINLNFGDTIEVPINYRDTQGTEIDLIFFNRDGSRRNMRNIDVLRSNAGILGNSTTTDFYKGRGHAQLPIIGGGETEIVLKANLSGRSKSVLFVKVVSEYFEAVGTIYWGSQEVKPGSLLEVPSSQHEIDLLFQDKNKNELDMNNYSIGYTESGVLGISNSSSTSKGHVILPILGEGETDVMLGDRATGYLKKIISVKVNGSILTWISSD